MATKKFKKEHWSIIAIVVLLVVSVVINITSAYFTDSASATSSSSLTFGTIDVDAKDFTTQSSTSYSISADEVAMKQTLYKLVEITNKQNTTTQPFYMRVSLSFYNGGQVDNSGNLVTFDIAEDSGDNNTIMTSAHFGSNYSSATNFAKNGTGANRHWYNGTDGKLYYKSEIDLPSSQSKIYIPVVITFEHDFGSDTFDNSYVVFSIEIIQSANNGYNGWGNSIPASGWPQA